MTPTLCIMGGCNGAGKTTLARELLPRMGLMRFLNADEIARGLSPLDPTLSAFKAGRLVIEEARTMIAAGTSFALESTLSGKTYAAMLRAAKERGYHIVLHYVMIASAAQAVQRVRLRVRMGGHDVPPTMSRDATNGVCGISSPTTCLLRMSGACGRIQVLLREKLPVTKPLSLIHISEPTRPY